MITSLSGSLGAPTVSPAFAVVWAAKAFSIELLHTATAGVYFFWDFSCVGDGICYIYNIRREAHLHLKGVSPHLLLPVLLLIHLLSSLPALFHYRTGGGSHLWHSMGKASERLELHVDYFATLWPGHVFGDATMGRWDGMGWDSTATLVCSLSTIWLIGG